MKGNESTPKFKDKILICEDCQTPFIFEAGEQTFYFIKELALPKRCKKCRLARKLNAKVGESNA